MTRRYFVRYSNYSPSMDLVPLDVSVVYTEAPLKICLLALVTLSIGTKGRTVICYIAPRHLIITLKV